MSKISISIRHFLFYFFLIAVMALISGCAREPEEVIKIGVAGPMEYIQGEHHWYGATLAMEEINRNGGINVGDNTYNIKLVRIDTKEMVDVAAAVSAIERAITADEVNFIVGGFRTEAVFPMTEIAADFKRIFLICGSATDELLKGRVDTDYDRWKYLFRVTPIRATRLAELSLIQLNEVVTILREEFGIERPKIAILAERLEWNEALIRFAQQLIEAPRAQRGLAAQHVGTWRPSATATDVTAELEAIRRAGAHIIYTINSGPVGVPFGRDWGRLEIPAVNVGITVDAQHPGYLEATDGYGDYVATVDIFVPAGAMKEFYDKFTERFGIAPIYTAGTYEAIYILKEAIERAGTLETDEIITELKRTDRQGTIGRVQFDEFHDVIWGPRHVLAAGAQWQDGVKKAFWPYNWRPDPVNRPDLVITLEGAVPYTLPPWVKRHFEAIAEK